MFAVGRYKYPLHLNFENSMMIVPAPCSSFHTHCALLPILGNVLEMGPSIHICLNVLGGGKLNGLRFNSSMPHLIPELWEIK